MQAKCNAMVKKKFKRGAGKFIQLEHWVYDSPAWQSLKPGPRALHVEMKRRFNGHNNGEIFLSQRDAAKALNIGRDTAEIYRKELVEKGFIVRTVGHYLGPVGIGQAAKWALTELPLGGNPATKEFLKWGK